MKLILHVGMPKAGSSALQSWLHEHSRELKRNGIFYPRGTVIFRNHHILLGSCIDKSDIPRHLKQKCEQRKTDLYSAFEGWRKRITPPSEKLTILSSENIFGMKHERNFQKLGEFLKSIYQEIQIVIYVRHPSRFYASWAQQSVKASHKISTPRPIKVRKPIELIEHYISENIDVHNYDDIRNKYSGIVEHFGANYSQTISELAEISNSQSVNTSFSAEGISILQLYREHHHKTRQNKFTIDTNALIKCLSEVDPQVQGFQKPKLNPEIEKYIWQSSTDLLWLKNRFDLIFNDINYEEIKMIPPPPSFQSTEDVFVINFERREKLQAALLFKLLNSNS